MKHRCCGGLDVQKLCKIIGEIVLKRTRKNKVKSKYDAVKNSFMDLFA